MEIKEVECNDICKMEDDKGNQCCYYCSLRCECDNPCRKYPPQCENSNARIE